MGRSDPEVDVRKGEIMGTEEGNIQSKGGPKKEAMVEYVCEFMVPVEQDGIIKNNKCFAFNGLRGCIDFDCNGRLIKTCSSLKVKITDKIEQVVRDVLNEDCSSWVHLSNGERGRIAKAVKEKVEESA